MKTSGFRQDFAFLYTIPPTSIIEIGGDGTSGKHPVLTPAPTDADDPLFIMLTTPEKVALDAGEKVLKRHSLDFPDGANGAAVLALSRAAYSDLAASALAEYTDKYAFIGQRFDKA